LTRKFLDTGRRSPLSDFDFDEVLGLCAGLNILPKRSFATDSAYRTGRDQQQALLQGGVQTLAPVMFPDASGFTLAFPPLPSRGEPSGLDRPYLPRRGVAGTSVPTFFAWAPKRRGLGSSPADLIRAAQNGALRRIVAFWPTVPGTDPQGLSVASPLIDSAARSGVSQGKIPFVTLRRRGAALLRRRARGPASAWRQAVIDTPQRCPHQIRSLDETVPLGGSAGPIRQRALTGLGRDPATLFLSHPAAGTGIAPGGSRWWAWRRRGFAKGASKHLSRRFVETGGTVQIPGERIRVSFARRRPNPLLGEAALEGEPRRVPWLGEKSLGFAFR
jgi:hypothetical protein